MITENGALYKHYNIMNTNYTKLHTFFNDFIWCNYWETFWLTSTPGFSHIMSRDRFELILSFLHYANDETMKVTWLEVSQAMTDCSRFVN